jgi:tetratricopeptide (TPR) repeat protein
MRSSLPRDGRRGTRTTRRGPDADRRCADRAAGPWRNAAGRCLAALGRFDEAERAFEDARAADPSNPVAASQLTALRRRMRFRERAERLLADDPDALFAAVEDARRKEADTGFQVEGRRLLARREPDNVAAVCALGAAQRRAGDLEGALNTYDHAWTLERSARDTAMTRVGRAAVLRELDRPDDARALYDAVLATRPDDAYALTGRAALYLDDVAKRGAGERALERAKALIDAIKGEWTSEVHAVHGRWRSLSGKA